MTHNFIPPFMEKKKRGRPRKIQPPENEPQFDLTLQVGDKQFHSTGSTVAQALRTLPRPTKITTKGFLYLKQGGRKFERAFRPQELKRFLWPISTDIQAKIISMGLK